ncbi:MAG TPA: SDR family NAD(P)-dependent oxidoreductase [Candidatus Omnitrophota bacterium]|nr:SDR family NAD(P)-dependent oxidoreductase [Candidatus Omnitrophota bacterium]HSA30941.1 SDR family NAD(P)-dependent oxidoreductase [Candidatus Omnitrophota bacterium]
MNSSHSKVILITGCSSGFGLLAAARLASKGHAVYATMRDLNKQGALINELKERNAQAKILPLDVCDPVSIGQVVKEIGADHGHIDVVINNAGYAIGGYFEDLTQEEIRSLMETNFFGVQNVTRAVIPLMRPKASGTIINISSISGRYGAPAFGAYNASKWALEGFSESLYYELRPFGIRVVLIEPGAYKTKIFGENQRLAKNFNNEGSPYFKRSHFLKALIDEHLKDNYRDPEDIAALIEQIIGKKDPALRYIPEIESRLQITLREILPFKLYSWIYQRMLFKGFKDH